MAGKRSIVILEYPDNTPSDLVVPVLRFGTTLIFDTRVSFVSDAPKQIRVPGVNESEGLK